MNAAERERYVQQIRLDALEFAARVFAAVDLLEQSAGGYSCTASGSDAAGARTANTDGPTVNAALALLDGRTDQARDALQKLDHELIEGANHLRIATRIVTANWIPGSEAGRAADAITRRIDDLWCSNHRRYDMWEPRTGDDTGTLCAWCAETKKPIKDGGFGYLPDAELIDARHRRGRLTTRDYDAFARRQRSQMSQRKAASRARRKGAA